MIWLTSMAAAANILAPSASVAGAAPMVHMAPACPAVPAPLPPEYSAWSQRLPVGAGASASAATTLSSGTAVTATLLPTRAIAYAAPPQKPGDAVSMGGMFAFSVPTAGRYRIVMGGAAWVDVLQGGKPIASVAHGRGPDCSVIRKTVDFDLAAGRSLLQIAGSKDSSLSLMVMPLPK